MDFDENCRVFKACNPMQTAKVLAVDICLNMALSCRKSVFTERGKTKPGLIKPAQMLAALSSDEALYKIVQEVESKTIQMIDLAS